MGMKIEEVKEYEKSFERSLDDTGINFITLRDYVNAKYILKDQYEERLKADMIAILKEIVLKITEKSYYDTTIIGDYEDEVRVYLVELDDVNDIIQNEINSLRGGENEHI